MFLLVVAAGRIEGHHPLSPPPPPPPPLPWLLRGDHSNHWPPTSTYLSLVSSHLHPRLIQMASAHPSRGSTINNIPHGNCWMTMELSCLETLLPQRFWTPSLLQTASATSTMGMVAMPVLRRRQRYLVMEDCAVQLQQQRQLWLPPRPPAARWMKVATRCLHVSNGSSLGMETWIIWTLEEITSGTRLVPPGLVKWWISSYNAHDILGSILLSHFISAIWMWTFLSPFHFLFLIYCECDWTITTLNETLKKSNAMRLVHTHRFHRNKSWWWRPQHILFSSWLLLTRIQFVLIFLFFLSSGTPRT